MCHRLRNILLIVFLVLLPYCMEAAQTAADSAYQRLSRFVQNIATFNRILPQEKVYLHFDNTAYYIGETIWFKAYVVRADTHRQTDLSGILHVQLITREGTVIDSRKLKIVDGQCDGSFDLKEQYASGYYEVRAYTQYMLNFGNIQWDYEKEAEAFFFNEEYCRRFYQENGTVFSRVFPVYQKPSSPGGWHEKVIRSRPRITGLLENWWKRQPGPQVKFYPEGGNLVKGLTSRVAFEIRGEQGEALSVRGLVKDRSGKTLTALKSDIRGRGEFYLLPQPGQKVTIQYKGKHYDYDLPNALSRGYVMTIRQIQSKKSSDETLQISVAGSDSLCMDLLGLTVVCRGRPLVFETLQPRRNIKGMTECHMEIATDLLEEGVCQVTLFSTNGQVYAERLVFVGHPEKRQAGVSINAQRTAYDPLQKVRIELKSESDGKVLAGTNLSVSVSDQAHREKTYTEENLMSNLLLSSDLYGFVENPSYYFGKGSKRKYDLELLMLTQGWRRYDFRQMTGQEQFVFRYRPEQRLGVSGRIYPLGGVSLLRKLRLQRGMNVVAYLEIDSFAVEGITKASPKGEFAFTIPEFSGQTLLFLRAWDNRDSTVTDSLTAGNKLLRRLVKAHRERPQEEFHMFSRKHYASEYYIVLHEGWMPHVRMLDYYETHPYEYERDETLAESMGLTVAEKGMGDEDYNMELGEVGISAKQILRRLDLSSPAIRLDMMDEMNLQLDLGMFYGSVSKGDIALNAVMRHGIRGVGDGTDKHKYEYGQRIETLYNNDDTDKATGEVSLLDDLLYGLVSAREEGMDRDGLHYSGDRDKDKPYYMHRYLNEQVKYQESNKVDVTRTNYPDSVKNVEYKSLDAVKKLNIFSDKTDRRIMDISEIRHVYSSTYIVDYEYGERVPMYRGRRLLFRGYSHPDDFYSPDYSHIDLKDPPKDYRRTLYWNPDLKTDDQGRATIEFYNNSTCRHMTISAEGLGPDGQLLVLER